MNTEQRLATVTNKERKICWRCLTARCDRKCPVIVCGDGGCVFTHHPLIHAAMVKRYASMNPGESETNNSAPPSGVRTMATITSRAAAKYKILPVILKYKNRIRTEFAFVDDGSDVSLMEESLSKELCCEGTSDPLLLKWTNEMTAQHPESHRVMVEVAGINTELCEMNNVRTVDKLDLPVQTLDQETIDAIFQHREGGPSPYKNAKPRLLIGLPHAHLVAPLEVRRGKEHLAINTPLGWVVYGGCNNDQSVPVRLSRVQHMRTVDENMEQKVRSFPETESFGERAAPVMLDKDVEVITAILHQTVKTVGPVFNPKESVKGRLVWVAATSTLDGEERKEAESADVKDVCHRVRTHLEDQDTRRLMEPISTPSEFLENRKEVDFFGVSGLATADPYVVCTNVEVCARSQVEILNVVKEMLSEGNECHLEEVQVRGEVFVAGSWHGEGDRELGVGYVRQESQQGASGVVRRDGLSSVQGDTGATQYLAGADPDHQRGVEREVASSGLCGQSGAEESIAARAFGQRAAEAQQLFADTGDGVSSHCVGHGRRAQGYADRVAVLDHLA